MTTTEVMALLEKNRNDRGIANWKKLGPKTGGLKSFGIGLTQLRKLARTVGRDRALAASLWHSDVYDARVIGMLIDDPKQITREQAERDVENLNAGMMVHIYSSCDATLAKSPLAYEIACDWIDTDDELRQRCGWGLIYELSKLKGRRAPDEAFFAACIARIRRDIHAKPMWVRESMNTAMMGMGKRSKALNQAAIAAVKDIGPLDIDYGLSLIHI